MKGKNEYVFFITFVMCFFLLPFVGEGWNRDKKITKVACIGDSITYGARLHDRSKNSYPANLQMLLGEEYYVENFGVGSCTLLKKGVPTVWEQLNKIKETNPDIVVISLGTNDTCGMGVCGNRKCWEYKDEFESDYLNLISLVQNWPSSPKIYICAPTPMVISTPGLKQSRIKNLNVRKQRLKELCKIIKKVAEKSDVKFINLNRPLRNKAELFTKGDGVHPNKDGYKKVAELVYEKIKN